MNLQSFMAGFAASWFIFELGPALIWTVRLIFTSKPQSPEDPKIKARIQEIDKEFSGFGKEL